MRIITAIISAFVAIVSANLAPAAKAGVLLSAGQSLRFNFDLSASPLTGPFTGGTHGVFLGAPDLMDPGDKVTLTLFNSANTLLAADSYQNQNNFPLGGPQFSTFFLTPTTDKVGHGVLTVDIGSVLVTSFVVLYNDGTHFTDFMFVPAEQGIPVTVGVPEPATVAMLGLGLVAVARLRRR